MKCFFSKYLCILVISSLVVLLPGMSIAQEEIPGELVFEDPFELDVDVPGWYTAGGGTLTVLGLVEDGINGEGDSIVLLAEDPGTGGSSNQYSNSFPLPENAHLYDWRVTFDIWVDEAPFTIIPIIAMNVDPWTGTNMSYDVETANEWVSADITIPAGDFLTTDPLLFIWHMGGNNAFEIRLDNLKVYLLNATNISDYMLYE